MLAIPESTPAANDTALRAELARLADEITCAGVRPELRYAVLGHLANATVELSRPHPDRAAVGRRIASAEQTLRAAGFQGALVDSLSRIHALV